MSRVVVENLTKIFKGPKGGDIPAVSELNLSLESGELLVLLGPSGCGKTTTLRLVAGLEEPTRGTIAIDGKVVNAVAPKERDVAMVFQNHALYPHMTVCENMEFGLKLRGFERAEIERRVGEAAAVLGLADCLARKPAELSGGQHQRVALGRAMVRKPALFLMDEPLSNLDAPTRSQLRRELAKMQRSMGATMIYVTHDQMEAMALGDRVAVMKAGALQQAGTPQEIYGDPANLFVAGFIGSLPMNFIHGTLSPVNNEMSFQADGGAGFTLRLGNDRLKTPGASRVAAIMGIRPEEIGQASGAGASPSTATTEVVVEAVESIGPETHLHAKTGAHAVLARMPADFQARIGEKVSLGFDARKVFFFEPDTGRRIR